MLTAIYHMLKDESNIEISGVAISIAAQLNKKPSAWSLNSLSLASRPKFNLLRKLLKNQRPGPAAPRPG